MRIARTIEVPLPANGTYTLRDLSAHYRTAEKAADLRMAANLRRSRALARNSTPAASRA